MSVTLDGEKIFDGQEAVVEVCSRSRAQQERAVPGISGMISIDLGERSRKIKQKGVLRARSVAEMSGKLDEINSFIDGDTHTMIIDGAQTLENLRMDSFSITKKQYSGGGLVWDYEIVYTQMRG